jgi:hypothetical protein
MKEILEYLDKNEIYYIRNQNTLTACLAGRFITIVMKEIGEQLTAARENELKRIRQSGGMVFAIDDPAIGIRIINSYIMKRGKYTDLERIKLAVATAMGISPKLIESEDRHTYASMARHIVMWKGVKMGFQTKQIAELCNRRNHTTVLHAFEKIEDIVQGPPRTDYDKRVLDIISTSHKLLDIQDNQYNLWIYC